MTIETPMTVATPTVVLWPSVSVPHSASLAMVPKITFEATFHRFDADLFLEECCWGDNMNLVGGWATPLKTMKVNWDDDIPNRWENKNWQPNHQPVNSMIISDDNNR